jgi:hypothetical protein
MATCRRDTANSRWQISRLGYDTVSRADDRAGRSHASSIAVRRVATRYPADRRGPDALA